MADEQRPDESNLTKRERQKARRQQRLEAERAAAAKAQRRRIGGFVIAGLLVLGAIGYFVQQYLAERRAEQELIAQAQENLEELGCTPVEEMESLGAGHFGGEELATNPPDAIYSHLPTTSGRHIGSVVATGVYDEPVDERVTTHNLEHGYVVLWYGEDADPDQVEELKEYARERIGEGDDQIVVAPYTQELDEGANFGFVAWERRQLCAQFDPGIALNFINEHVDDARAPEAFAGPHHAGEQGVLVPGDDEVLFPPLAEGPAGPRVPEEDGAPELEEPDMDPDAEETDEDAGEGAADS